MSNTFLTWSSLFTLCEAQACPKIVIREISLDILILLTKIFHKHNVVICITAENANKANKETKTLTSLPVPSNVDEKCNLDNFNEMYMYKWRCGIQLKNAANWSIHRKKHAYECCRCDWHATLIIKMIQKISLAPFAYTYVYFFYTLFRIIQLTLVNYKFRAVEIALHVDFIMWSFLLLHKKLLAKRILLEKSFPERRIGYKLLRIR